MSLVRDMSRGHARPPTRLVSLLYLLVSGIRCIHHLLSDSERFPGELRDSTAEALKIHQRMSGR